MNWTKLKTYLIILLVAINLFLAISYINSIKKDSYLDNGAITNTVEFLAKQGIEISKETIPTKIYNSNIIECSYNDNYYENVAISISSSDKESINILPDKSIKITTQNGDSFTFDSNFNFTYISTSFKEENTLSTLEFTHDNDKSVSLTKEQHKKIENFLYPEYQQNKVFSYSIKSVTPKGNDSISLTCIQIIDNTPINNHLVTFELQGNDILAASGTWFFPTEAESYTYNLYDQLSILIKEAQLHKSGDMSNVNYKISSLNHVYSTYWSANKDNVYFVPSWKISTDDSQDRIYNTISCELYS